MRKFENHDDDSIIFTKDVGKSRNLIMIESKIRHISDSVEPGSLILIDGPLIGGNASHYYYKMDECLRSLNCIPIYFVKNSSSRLIIDHYEAMQKEFNNDFHWAVKFLGPLERTAFVKYTDVNNKNNSKVFTYIKVLDGFPERIEMHTKTFDKHISEIGKIMELVSYFFIAQGDYTNPQVRPIAIAEKYAREGLKILNIPVLLGRMGFHPTINQVRFR